MAITPPSTPSNSIQPPSSHTSSKSSEKVSENAGDGNASKQAIGFPQKTGNTPPSVHQSSLICCCLPKFQSFFGARTANVAPDHFVNAKLPNMPKAPSGVDGLRADFKTGGPGAPDGTGDDKAVFNFKNGTIDRKKISAFVAEAKTFLPPLSNPTARQTDAKRQLDACLNNFGKIFEKIDDRITATDKENRKAQEAEERKKKLEAVPNEKVKLPQKTIDGLAKLTRTGVQFDRIPRDESKILEPKETRVPEIKVMDTSEPESIRETAPEISDTDPAQAAELTPEQKVEIEEELGLLIRDAFDNLAHAAYRLSDALRPSLMDRLQDKWQQKKQASGEKTTISKTTSDCQKREDLANEVLCHAIAFKEYKRFHYTGAQPFRFEAAANRHVEHWKTGPQFSLVEQRPGTYIKRGVGVGVEAGVGPNFGGIFFGPVAAVNLGTAKADIDDDDDDLNEWKNNSVNLSLGAEVSTLTKNGRLAVDLGVNHGDWTSASTNPKDKVKLDFEREANGTWWRSSSASPRARKRQLRMQQAAYHFHRWGLGNEMAALPKRPVDANDKKLGKGIGRTVLEAAARKADEYRRKREGISNEKGGPDQNRSYRKLALEAYPSIDTQVRRHGPQVFNPIKESSGNPYAVGQKKWWRPTFLQPHVAVNWSRQAIKQHGFNEMIGASGPDFSATLGYNQYNFDLEMASDAPSQLNGKETAKALALFGQYDALLQSPWRRDFAFFNLYQAVKNRVSGDRFDPTATDKNWISPKVALDDYVTAKKPRTTANETNRPMQETPDPISPAIGTWETQGIPEVNLEEVEEEVDEEEAKILDLYGGEANIPAHFIDSITHPSSKKLRKVTETIESLQETYTKFIANAEKFLAQKEGFLREDLKHAQIEAYNRINDEIWGGAEVGYPGGFAKARKNPEKFIYRSYDALGTALACAGAHLPIIKFELTEKAKAGGLSQDTMKKLDNDIRKADDAYKNHRKLIDNVYLRSRFLAIQRHTTLIETAKFQRHNFSAKARSSAGLNVDTGALVQGVLPFDIANEAGTVIGTLEAQYQIAPRQVHRGRLGHYLQFTVSAETGIPLEGLLGKKHLIADCIAKAMTKIYETPKLKKLIEAESSEKDLSAKPAATATGKFRLLKSGWKAARKAKDEMVEDLKEKASRGLNRDDAEAFAKRVADIALSLVHDQLVGGALVIKLHQSPREGAFDFSGFKEQYTRVMDTKTGGPNVSRAVDTQFGKFKFKFNAGSTIVSNIKDWLGTDPSIHMMMLGTLDKVLAKAELAVNKKPAKENKSAPLSEQLGSGNDTGEGVGQDAEENIEQAIWEARKNALLNNEWVLTKWFGKKKSICGVVDEFQNSRTARHWYKTIAASSSASSEDQENAEKMLAHYAKNPPPQNNVFDDYFWHDETARGVRYGNITQYYAAGSTSVPDNPLGIDVPQPLGQPDKPLYREEGLPPALAVKWLDIQEKMTALTKEELVDYYFDTPEGRQVFSTYLRVCRAAKAINGTSYPNITQKPYGLFTTFRNRKYRKLVKAAKLAMPTSRPLSGPTRSRPVSPNASSEALNAAFDEASSDTSSNSQKSLTTSKGIFFIGDQPLDEKIGRASVDETHSQPSTKDSWTDASISKRAGNKIPRGESRKKRTSLTVPSVSSKYSSSVQSVGEGFQGNRRRDFANSVKSEKPGPQSEVANEPSTATKLVESFKRVASAKKLTHKVTYGIDLMGNSKTLWLNTRDEVTKLWSGEFTKARNVIHDQLGVAIAGHLLQLKDGSVVPVYRLPGAAKDYHPMQIGEQCGRHCYNMLFPERAPVSHKEISEVFHSWLLKPRGEENRLPSTDGWLDKWKKNNPAAPASDGLRAYADYLGNGKDLFLLADFHNQVFKNEINAGELESLVAGSFSLMHKPSELYTQFERDLEGATEFTVGCKYSGDTKPGETPEITSETPEHNLTLRQSGKNGNFQVWDTRKREQIDLEATEATAALTEFMRKYSPSYRRGADWVHPCEYLVKARKNASDAASASSESPFLVRRGSSFLNLTRAMLSGSASRRQSLVVDIVPNESGNKTPTEESIPEESAVPDSVPVQSLEESFVLVTETTPTESGNNTSAAGQSTEKPGVPDIFADLSAEIEANWGAADAIAAKLSQAKQSMANFTAPLQAAVFHSSAVEIMEELRLCLDQIRDAQDAMAGRVGADSSTQCSLAILFNAAESLETAVNAEPDTRPDADRPSQWEHAKTGIASLKSDIRQAQENIKPPTSS